MLICTRSLLCALIFYIPILIILSASYGKLNFFAVKITYATLKCTLRVQKYGNDGLKHGGKDVLWCMSLVTKGRFSLQPRPQFKLLRRENIRHLVFCLSNRQGQVLEKLFMNFETKTSK